MKFRDTLLGLAVVAATGFAGCAVCDTCDDFPLPCTGPNCGANGMPAYLGGGQGLPVMGTNTPTYRGVDDSAGAGPTMPPEAPAAPAGTPPTPPASM